MEDIKFFQTYHLLIKIKLLMLVMELIMKFQYKYENIENKITNFVQQVIQ